ncbi:MAG: PEP-CTERM sorting domain-containing protein [Bryobacterales bacterium]|nr:PEP-CTERM sorting domain-containing protein [Bryobacterales bacterium]
MYEGVRAARQKYFGDQVKTMKRTGSSLLLLGVLLLVFSLTCSAGTIGPTLSGGEMLYATGGEVWAYFVSAVASFDAQVWMENGGSWGPFFQNHGTAPGFAFSLGTHSAGTPLTFELQVSTPEPDWWWYTGPGSGNSDGAIHAVYTRWVADSVVPYDGWLVSFEDWGWPGSDADYEDLQFVVRGAAPIPEPASFVLLGGGLLALGLLSRKRR